MSSPPLILAGAPSTKGFSLALSDCPSITVLIYRPAVIFI